jgi:predicted dinucleotide-binding enzyme
VQFGVRSDAKTKELLDRCKGASAVPVADAIAWGDVVFLALPGSAAMDVVRPLADKLKGKIVVDCNNPLTWKDGPVWAPPTEGSLAQAIAKAAPGARVIKGFNTFGAEHHADPMLAGAPLQVFLAGDDADAKKVVMAVATQAGFEPVDAGPLRNAPVLENLAILWIHLAMVGGQGRTFAFRMQKK